MKGGSKIKGLNERKKMNVNEVLKEFDVAMFYKSEKRRKVKWSYSKFLFV